MSASSPLPIRRGRAAGTATALTTVLGTVGALVVVAPAAHADDVTKTVEVTHACDVYNSNYGNHVLDATLSPDRVDVTYPESVAPNQTFTVTIQPGEMHSGIEQVGRMSYDIALPTNGTVAGVELAGGDRGIVVGGDGQLKVSRVGTRGGKDDNGPVARIWGGYSVYYGANYDQKDLTKGITVAPNTTFRLPAVRITMVAPPTAGETISAGLTRAGRNGANGSADNTIQLNEGTVTPKAADSAYCGSSANAAKLTTTTVADLPPVLSASTTTMAETAVQVDSGATDTEISATVAAPGVDDDVISSGSVEFVDADTGAVLGSAKPDYDGTASITHTFPVLTAGETQHAYKVKARYSGVEKRIEPSESGTTTYTVTPKQYRQVTSTAALTATQGVAADGAVPVDLRATFTRTPAGSYPKGLKAQLMRDGKEIGQPVELQGNTATFADSVPSGDATYRYSAKLLDATVGDDHFVPTTSGEVVMRVGNGATTPTVPATGSLGSLSGLFGSLSGLFGSLK